MPLPQRAHLRGFMPISANLGAFGKAFWGKIAKNIDKFVERKCFFSNFLVHHDGIRGGVSHNGNQSVTDRFAPTVVSYPGYEYPGYESTGTGKPHNALKWYLWENVVTSTAVVPFTHEFFSRARRPLGVRREFSSNLHSLNHKLQFVQAIYLYVWLKHGWRKCRAFWWNAAGHSATMRRRDHWGTMLS